VRVIVTGGRDFNNWPCVRDALTYVHEVRGPITELVHGDARGADSLADRWAREHGIDPIPYPADWVAHPAAAGPIRNSQMAKDGADLVIAFPGGDGTADMVRKARRAGIMVVRVCEPVEIARRGLLRG